MKTYKKPVFVMSMFAGGLLWVIFGVVLALKPAGIQGVSYRESHVVMPWLGIGTILIAFGIICLYREMKHYNHGIKLSYYSILLGAFLFFLGESIIRTFSIGMWEPTAPIGFLLLIIGLFVFSLLSILSKSLPISVSLLLFISSICLLLFNDQYERAWMAVPFGLAWIVIAIIFSRWNNRSERT